MKIFPFKIADEPVEVRVIEDTSDLDEAIEFMRHADTFDLALDTETTGLNIFNPEFRIRTLQIGTGELAYVLPMASVRDSRARRMLDVALDRGVSIHNAPFDLVAIDVTGLYALKDMEEHYHDTKIMAHLIDPRGRMDGGVGFKLKELSARYIDPSAPDTQNDLKEEFRKIKKTLETGWAAIDINNPTYLLYAGLDVILTSRLHRRLRYMLNNEGYGRLARFEHEVQRVTTRMKRRGFKIDVEYTKVLLARLEERNANGVEIARQLGVDNINSTQQIANALVEKGWEPTQYTKTGKPKVDKAVLEEVATYTGDYSTLANAIIDAKRAAKWKKAYAEAMLNGRDDWDLVHPDINSLQARTGRMSIGNPPLQQLPSRGDDAWIIRRQVIARDNKLIISADYDQVEFRVLAALADIKQMKYAIENGIDLHDYTAKLIYGDNFTKAERSMGKGIGFGKVFGGGAATLSRQTGAPIDRVRAAIADYEAVYPELPAYAEKLKKEQRRNGGFIINHNGRYQPLDSGREYAAVNYSVQSVARDLLAQSLIDLSNAGLDDYLLLPVHDEVLAEAPREDALDIARFIGKTMSRTFEGVPITASGEVYGRSWAEGYVYTDDAGVVRSKGTGNELHDWVAPTG